MSSLKSFGTLLAIALVAIAGTDTALAAEVLGEPKEWQMGLQAAYSPTMHWMTWFHNMLLVVITVISLFVLGLLVWVMLRYNEKANPTPSRFTHNWTLEVIWTVIPIIILAVIFVPSMQLLYYSDKAPDAEMTVKAVGHQWYWSYEYPDHGDFTFDSYMIPEDELKEGQRRLLAVDNRFVVPVDTTIRLLVTATDVLHAFAMPSLGLKLDAVPGRLHETWMRIEAEGIYYGQCSEICGVNHAYMPIAIEAVSKERFAEWVEEAKVAYGVRQPAQPAPASLADSDATDAEDDADATRLARNAASEAREEKR
jgi:cytochrome c oxidase subunit 2